MSLTIEEILAARENRVVPVKVPEWGGVVYVRRLSALEAVDLGESLRDTDGEGRRSRVIAALQAYLCDQDGKAIATADQAKAIASKSAGVVNRIITAGHRLNAMTDPGADDVAKNSVPSRGDSSPTG